MKIKLSIEAAKREEDILLGRNIKRLKDIYTWEELEKFLLNTIL